MFIDAVLLVSGLLNIISVLRHLDPCIGPFANAVFFRKQLFYFA